MSEAKLLRLTLDGQPLTVEAGTTVLQAADRAGVVIPRFCFHPAFPPEGNCRMCLVEIEGLPKLELACSTAVRDGMLVHTSTPKVLEARRDVLGFLLADHPLDCPVCDKAGECFLQDYYGLHSRAAGRFAEVKEKKAKLVAIAPSLILDRERCILCTRCVRFLQRVTGTGELGVFARGARAEIGIDEGREIGNNYSGNLVDICPVGAITDRHFRFKTRTWFLERGRTVCPRCGRGCRVDVQFVRGYPLPAAGTRVFRLQAVENPAVNGHWICDFGRYGVVRDLEDDRLADVASKAAGSLGWEAVLEEIAFRLEVLQTAGRESRIALILNTFLTNEELDLARRVFVEKLGVGRVSLADPPAAESDGLLLTADRTPNRRGASERGFAAGPPELDELAAGTDLLIVFGPHLTGLFPPELVRAAWEKIGFKVLMSARACGLEPLADLVLPAALPAEKGGTFTNVNGLSQSFGPVLEAPGRALSEREVLERLADRLGVRRG
jgi:NADH-quinone oxidoreductase subunit G